jgi:hypothetical protein
MDKPAKAEGIRTVSRAGTPDHGKSRVPGFHDCSSSLALAHRGCVKWDA